MQTNGLIGGLSQGIKPSKHLPWAGLSLILAIYITAVLSLRPTNFFGATEDDSIYFSSAKALAEGRGYILPSVPGTPPATKYPILYPLILSIVWKIKPSFPANVPWAIAVTVAFGLVYLVAGLIFLRRLQVLNDAEALLITAFCALHPVVLLYSASVLSDIPFAAFALVAMLLADSMVRPAARPQFAVLCGVVAGLSMLVRMFGLAIVAGILLAAVVRRTWKQMFLFAASIAPFLLFIVWRASLATRIVAPVSNNDAATLGWVRAWAYYTNYFAIWKVSVPNAHIFWAMISNNLGLLIQSPADFFLSPLLVSDSMTGRALVLLVSVMAVAGLVRQAFLRGWAPFHYVLPFYALIIVLWNYPDASNRFLLPFCFLLVAGLWLEMRRILVVVQSKISSGSTHSERFMAAVFGVAMLFIGFGIIVNYVNGHRRNLYALSRQRESILKPKQEAYRWLADHDCCSPVLAYEDADVYLYSGRTAMRPVIFVTSSIYEPKILDGSLGHILDVGRAINAGYWLFSEDDFAMESENAMSAIRNCLGVLGPNDWRASFKSNDGRVVLRKFPSGADHDLNCGRKIH
jgi:4-amino-4-deoxy-L-arabinose transferase-like glycosyltransferase